jgi:hypothetical protein
VYTVTPSPPQAAQLAICYGLTGQTTRANNGNLVSPSAAGEKNRLGAPFGCHSLRRRGPLGVSGWSHSHPGSLTLPCTAVPGKILM